MLFDLRSRRRRGAVKVIYLSLALLMGGGLVLFGVGTGNGNGGLLNGLSNSGGGGGGNSVAAQQVRSALKSVRADPHSPAAWGSLVQAYWADANQSPNLNTSTGVFSATGQRLLRDTTSAYQKYASLTSSPNPDVTLLGARAYVILRNWPAAANAWETVASAEKNAPSAFECMALTAYAAGQTDKGNLAYAKAVSLFPGVSRAELTAQLKAAKADPSAYAAQEC
jgi:hypothetical protein